MILLPMDWGNDIDTQIEMVIDAIFRGIDKEEHVKKHYSLSLTILADIYKILCLWKIGFYSPKGVISCINGGCLKTWFKQTVLKNSICPIQQKWVPLINMSFV